ncbi:zinc finger domain-containing protein [Methylocystis parvus]
MSSSRSRSTPCARCWRPSRSEVSAPRHAA